MIRDFGTGLASDFILHRFGFDGNESKEILHGCKRYSLLGVRSTFAINTYYPEIKGAYYENRALFRLIDESLRTLALMPVLSDCFSSLSDQLNPVEGLGQLRVGESYALISAHEAHVGFLQIWKFHAGGGGDYYADREILDFVLPHEISKLLVDDVERRCHEGTVRFSREASFE